MSALSDKIHKQRERLLTLYATVGALLFAPPFSSAPEEVKDLQNDAMKSLRSGRNWTGEVLKGLNEPDPYPSSRDPKLKAVEPSADVPVDTGSQVADFYDPKWDLVARIKALRSVFANEITELKQAFNNWPHVNGSKTDVQGVSLPLPFFDFGFIALENAITNLTEANHSLGWMLPIIGKDRIVAPETNHKATSTTSQTIGGTVTSTPTVSESITTTLPNAGAPADLQPKSETPTPTTVNTDISASESPEISEGQALLNQISSDYPKLVSDVQEPMTLKQAQHLLSIYPDPAYITLIFDKMYQLHLTEIDDKGATSVLSPYTSFMMLDAQTMAEAEKSGKEENEMQLPDQKAPGTDLAEPKVTE